MWTAITGVVLAASACLGLLLQWRSDTLLRQPYVALTCHHFLPNIADYERPPLYYAMLNFRAPIGLMGTISKWNAPKNADDFVMCYLGSFGSYSLVDIAVTLHVSEDIPNATLSLQFPVKVQSMQAQTYTFGLVNALKRPVRITAIDFTARTNDNTESHAVNLILTGDTKRLMTSVIYPSKEDWPRGGVALDQ